MFTNHVLALDVGHAQRSACCDPRGRLQGLIDIVRTADEELLVVLEGRTADDFIAHYDRYLLMDDAELVDVSGGRTHVWVEGEVDAAGLHYRRRRAGRDGFDVITDEPAALGPFDDAAFEQARIASGDVRWPVDMSDKQLVHELGLRDEVLYFGKGCYLGQETINRLDVRGGVKQRLVGLDLEGPADPGAEVRAEDKAVGVLRSVIRHDELGWIGLSVVRMPHDEPGTRLRVGEREALVVSLPR